MAKNISEELDWLESKANSIKQYVDANPYHLVQDRTVTKYTKDGAAYEDIVQRKTRNKGGTLMATKSELVERLAKRFKGVPNFDITDAEELVDDALKAHGLIAS